MGVDAILPEPLHAKVIDETVLYHRVHVRCYLSIADGRLNEPECHSKSVAVERPKL